MERSPHEYVVARQYAAEYAEGIAAYLNDADENDVLRPHQLEVFGDVRDFFEEGNTRGYINLPTGTGKTVLFVEMTKALMAGRAPENRPKVLVATPTKDLVHQTLGRSGEKGYGRFAPGLKIGSYFSETSSYERQHIDDYDVVVTTYRSLDIMHSTMEMRKIESGEDDLFYRFRNQLAKSIGKTAANEMLQGETRRVPTGRNLLDKFDVLILDEAHHALSRNVSAIIRNLPRRKVVVGFTATPDASEQRQLQATLPTRIHEMNLAEAVDMGLLAPVAPVGVRSNVVIKSGEIYNDRGEFIDERISYLAHDQGRNELIMKAAEILTKEGVGTIISCIAGGEAWHARYLAEQLQERGVRAKAVHSSVTGSQRQELYRQFEAGELDLLTFVGVLGEGWDSERAKGLINARPTRSPIIAPQRLGRVTRLGGTAITVDICDDYSEQNLNPPITVADVLREGALDFGEFIGQPADQEHADYILHLLKKSLPVLPRLENNYTDFGAMLSALGKLDRGRVTAETGGLYAVPNQVHNTYTGVTDEFINHASQIHNHEVPAILAAQGTLMRTVYNVREAQKLLQKLPLIDPERYHIDDEGIKWMGVRGLAKLFSKRYPEVTEEVVEQVLQLDSNNLPWIPARYMSSPPKSHFRRFKAARLYRHDQDTISTLNGALHDHFSPEI